MRLLLRLTAGWIVWAAALCVIYGLHGVSCAGGWDSRLVAGVSTHRLALMAAWSAACLIGVALAVRLSRHTDKPLDRAVAASAWAGVVANVVTFLPVLWVPDCI